MTSSRQLWYASRQPCGWWAAAALLLCVCSPKTSVAPGDEPPGNVAQLDVFDPASIGPGAPPPSVPAAPPSVRGYGPQATSGGGEIHVRFDQPIKPLGVREATDLRIEVQPEVAGRTEWKTPELLVFVPEKPLEDAHRYTVTVRGTVKTPAGTTWAGPLSWELKTRSPSVYTSYPGDGANNVRRLQPIILEFDQPVAIDQVRKHLQVETKLGEGKRAPADVRVTHTTPRDTKRHELEWDSTYKDRWFTVRPRQPWPRGAHVYTTIRSGVVGMRGPVAAENSWTGEFETVRPLAVESVNCTSKDPCGLEPISIELNNPIDKRALRQVRVTPRPKNFRIDLVDDWGDDGGHELLLEGMFLPGQTYTVELPAGLRDRWGERLGKTWRHRAEFGFVPTLGLSPESGVLLADSKRTIGVVSREVQKVSVRAAVFSDSDLAQLAPQNQRWRKQPWPQNPLATARKELSLDPKGPTKWSALPIDLKSLVGDQKRPVAIEVSAVELTDRADGEPLPSAVRAVYRVTNLGPHVFASQARTVVGVHDLRNGKPVANATISRLVGSATPTMLGQTDNHGLLDLSSSAMPPVRASDSPGVLVARSQSEVAVLTADGFSQLKGSFATDTDKEVRPGERVLGKLISERGAYRPGELIRVVGWTGVETPYARTGLRRLKPGQTVELWLTDSRNETVAKKQVAVTKEGKYWAELILPKAAKLGYYRVHATVSGKEFVARVKVEDYRTPAFEVSATTPKSDWLKGQAATVNVHANYFFGGSVPLTKLRSRTACRAMNYRPPGLGSGWYVGIRKWRYSRGGGPSVVHPLSQKDRSSGSYTMSVAPPLVAEIETNRCQVSIGVQDITRQEIGAETSFTVHPASHYVAIELPSRYLWTNDQLAVPVRVVDWQGTRGSGDVSLQIIRRYEEPVYKHVGGKRVYDGEQTREKVVKTCRWTTSAVGKDDVCTLKTLKAGEYKIVAEGTFAGQLARTEADVHVWRSRTSKTVARQAPPKTLEIEASRTVVRPGEQVTVTVRGPWEDAAGVLVASRAGVRDSFPFVLQDHRAEVSLTSDDSWSPGVALNATVALGRDAGWPKLVRARQQWVSQGTNHRVLNVAVEAAATARPREKVDIAVDVRAANQQPIDGRLALWAVDEAVLSLTDYEVPDILKEFVPAKDSGVYTGDDYRHIVASFTPHGDPWLWNRGFGSGVGYGSGAGFGGRGKRGSGGPPPARQKFETTPLFLGDVAVRKGRATAKVELPDNLTTYRVFAVASARLSDGKSPGRFGVGEARIQVSTPLMVRPALPRTLRPNDRAQLAAIVQNNTSDAGEVTVSVRELAKPGDRAKPVAASRAALGLRGQQRVTLPVAAGQQLRIPFEVDALRAATPYVEFDARFVGKTNHADRVQVPVPIAPEATLTERVATYGSLAADRPIAIPVALPADVLPEHGGLDLSTSSSLLAGLQDAVADLVHYPYGCIEQTSSRLLPLVALADLSARYPLGIDNVDEFVRAGVERILSMQTHGGGFAYWPGGTRPHAYATAYATWVLLLARDGGHNVPAAAIDRALTYLEHQLSRESDGELAHQRLYSYVRQAIAAYTLARAGRNVETVLERLHSRRNAMPIFARAFVWMALHHARPNDPRAMAMASEILGELAEQPGTAHVNERIAYDLQEVFHSSTRSDAIVLLGLLEVVPDHPVVEKLARGLLGGRVGGRWRNTQENAYAVLALAAYAKVYERETPDFVARGWVGRKPVLDHSFVGRTFEQGTTKVAMVDLLANARGNQTTGDGGAPAASPISMILQRIGRGRMYYRLGVEWAPAATQLPAAAHGLGVARSLRGEDGQPLGGRALKPGELVALDLEVHADTRVPYVVIDAPIPAGLEVVHRNLGKGQAVTAIGGPRGYWVSHEEQRRDRALVFADNLPSGTLRHSVPLRATTPGRYAMPPTQIAAMYMPEVYGRSTGEVVEIK